MRIEQDLKNANSALIAGNLPSKSSLLEYFRYTEIDFKAVPARGERRLKPARYCVFVLETGEPENVKMIDLGEADKIDRVIAAYRSKLTGDMHDSLYENVQLNKNIQMETHLSSSRKENPYFIILNTGALN